MTDRARIGTEPTTRVRVPKMAELVAQQLRRQIVRAEIPAGYLLPSEAQLMERYGVSRPTMREAFRVLESEGLIAVGRGVRGGAQVLPPDADMAAKSVGLVLEYRGTTLRDVYDARKILEPPCASLLARKRTRADLDRLRQAHAASQLLANDSAALIRSHIAFHILLIELAGNQTISVLHHMVCRIIDRSSEGRVVADNGRPEGQRYLRKAARAHERMIDLVEAREASTAEDLWHQHLTDAAAYVVGGADSTAVIDLLD